MVAALIDGLSGEKVHWTEQRKQFRSQINRQVTDKRGIASSFFTFSVLTEVIVTMYKDLMQCNTINYRQYQCSVLSIRGFSMWPLTICCRLLDRLVGDVLQLTGFLSYCGPFNQNFRNMLLKDIWEAELRKRKIPFTDNLNIISMLVDPPTVRKDHECSSEFNFTFELQTKQSSTKLAFESQRITP